MSQTGTAAEMIFDLHTRLEAAERRIIAQESELDTINRALVTQAQTAERKLMTAREALKECRLLFAHDHRNRAQQRKGRKMPEPREELPACAALKLSSGLIVAGKRHNDCLSTMNYHGIPSADARSAEQGFMTTLGRFVTRREARYLAECAEMEPAQGHWMNRMELYSEDLY